MDSAASRTAQSTSSLHQISDLTVTVVICTRNRPGDLRKCLGAVAALTPAADEVLVVDNSGGSEETARVAQSFSVLYTVEPRQGLSRARNRGLDESTSDIVAYLDDDACPDKHWLGLLLEPFADQHVAAATGKIITPDSENCGGLQETPRVLNNKVPQWFEIATFGGLGLGSNMALRKAACAGSIIFDERLGRGAPFQIADEHFAFASLLSRGYTVVYLPTAIVYHPPLTRGTIEQETRNSIAYWLLLFAEFPHQRADLVQFLWRRFRRKRLTWARETQEPGEIINSGWRVQLKAGLRALLLFLRTKRPKRR